jgi:hypothetical protein
MKNEWLHFTGWVNMLRPYILPFWMILIFFYTLLINKLVLGVFKIPKETYSLFEFSLCTSIICFCAFLLECVFTHVFVTLMHFNDPKYGFVTVRDSFGISIYENISFFVFTFISVCFCTYITYKLNSRFTMQHLTIPSENKNQAILFISILTSPLVFFISLRQALSILIPIRW